MNEEGNIEWLLVLQILSGSALVLIQIIICLWLFLCAISLLWDYAASWQNVMYGGGGRGGGGATGASGGGGRSS